MHRILLGVPLAQVPELLRRAVAEVPHAHLVELTDDGALLSRVTSIAVRAEATRLAFTAAGPEKTEVHVVVPTRGPLGLVNGFSVRAGGVGRDVLVALERLAGPEAVPGA